MFDRRLLRAGLASVVVALASVGAAPAFAGPGGDPPSGPTDPTPAQRIVHRAVRGMVAIADAACTALREASAEVVQRIARLDRAGAEDAQIISAGQAAAERLNARAAGALREINSIKTRALAALADNAGTPEDAARVNRAAAAAAGRVTECRDAALARVRAAVARATGGG